MRILKSKPTCLLIILCFTLALTALPALAGTGKISGVVRDADTKEPIMGANVLIEGTTQGAPTDLEGTFIIVNVQPGKYVIKVTAVGYISSRQTDVLVQSDLNTKLDVVLKPTILEGEEVTVVYEKPTVILDQTSNARIMTSEDLSKLVITDLTDAIARQSGFTIDAEGNIHARGGRSDENLFIVDGMDVRDPIVGTKVNFDLNAVNIEELQVLTGGFNAEYGKAQSAIINITTREGDIDKYTGLVKYTTDNLIDNTSFNSDRMELSLGGPIPFSKALLGKPVTFYYSGSADLTDTYTPLNQTRADNDYLNAGIDLPERTDNEFASSMKLAYQLAGTQKITLTANEYFHMWDIYPDGEGGVDGNYGWRYKYNTQNRPWALNKRGQVNLNYTHQLSDKSFYEVQLGRFATRSQVRPGGGVEPGNFTLEGQIEDEYNEYSDNNGDGVIDAADTEKHIPFEGFVDANHNGVYDGSGEGYEDLNGDGEWDQGEDFIDLNANGMYDYAEPWIDRINPDTGENHIGQFDPWDDYSDLNGNGLWDGNEPQLPEQDWNQNGRWDGERLWDTDGDAEWDHTGYTEGYYDENLDGRINKKMNFRQDEDTAEPFFDGDFYYDTGEPFIDTPDESGFYNGHWEEGEIFFDLPSSNSNPASLDFVYEAPQLNGIYDPPNGYFDEYELFTEPAIPGYGYDPSMPVNYRYNPLNHGSEWRDLNFWFYQPGYSTWTNLNNPNYTTRMFNPPNNRYDQGEQYVDYNGNGQRDVVDHFLNPGQWDYEAYWYDRKTIEYSAKFDFTSQVSKSHELKVGTELKYREMSMQSISGPNQPYTNPDVPLPAGSAWPDRGDVRDFYNYTPYEGALYLQDKMEFEGLIVNLGIRGDFILHDPSLVDQSQTAVAEGQPGATLAKRGTYQIAPRLGISHPITDRSKLYFNYGHFYQAPSYQYFFRSNTGNILPGGLIGNPNLKYEKTVQYALGVQTQVTEDLTFTVEGYYKDIYGLISTVPEYIVSGYTLDRYTNLDYGRVRGFEVTIENNFSRNFQVQLKWDFSYAFGKASSALAAQQYRLSNVPVNKDEHPLDWDETNKINVYSSLIYQKGEYPILLGQKIPVDNWLMTLEWSYGSGGPYTPSRYTTGLDPNEIKQNSARYPWHEQTNLKVEKYFPLTKGSTRVTAGMEIRNLFNSRNLRSLYTETGNAYDSTHPENNESGYSEYYPGPYDVGTDYDHNPRNYDPPRQILLSLGFMF